MSNLLLMSYDGPRWKFALPTVPAYNFDKQTLDDFLHGDAKSPLVLDINLAGGCSSECIYCFTESGRTERFYSIFDSPGVPKLNGKHLEDVIRQFGALGGKTIFLCSEGEPLLNPSRVMKLIDVADEKGIRVLLSTNVLHLTPNLVRQLHAKSVNMMLKLESLDPEKNSQTLNPKISLKYGTLNGAQIPRPIIDSFQIYGTDSNMLGLSSIIIKPNLADVVDVREFAYKHGNIHFAKHLYIGGRAIVNRNKLALTDDERRGVNERIQRLDNANGVVYPNGNVLADNYSFDVRRFLNNAVDSHGFPLRMASDVRGGVFLSSDIVKPSFGFGNLITVSMLDGTGKVDLSAYFSRIREIVYHYQK